MPPYVRPAPSTGPPSLPMPITFRAELGRKALHVVTALLPVLLFPLGRAWLIGLAALLVALTLGGDVLRAKVPAFGRWIGQHFGWMMRAEEHPDGTGPLTLNGSTWVAIAALLLAVLLPLRLAVPVFAAFMLGDAAAALVGRAAGRHRWPGTSRTLEGSAAFALVSTAVLLLLPRAAPVAMPGALPALVAAGAMALAEALPVPLNDNLRVPFVGALVLYAFGWA